MSKEPVEESTIVRTYKYPMYPSKDQERILLSWMEKAKWIYNLALQEHERLYSLKKNNPTAYAEAQKAGIRKKGKNKGTFSQDTAIYSKVKEFIHKYPDLQELPSVCVDKILEQVEQAYSDFFKNIKTKKTGGYLKPQDKTFRDNFSLKCKNGGFNVRIVGNRSSRVFGFPIPKIWRMGSKGYRALKKGFKIRHFKNADGSSLCDGNARTQTILREGDSWYLCVSVKQERSLGPENKLPSVGVDLGISRTVQLSNGVHMSLPKTEMDNLFARKKVLQRRLKRKKGGNRNKREKQSNNYKKACAKIAKIDEKIANIRRYWQKKCATEIARTYQVVVVERLKVKNMTKSAKGTVEDPGKNVKAKSGLNRSILMTSPSFFRTFLEQKCKQFGSIYIEVDPKFTSQMCSKCGVVDKTSRINQAEFKCSSCGFELNADHNAAINILNKGISGKTEKVA